MSSVAGVILAGTFPWANSAFDRLWPRPLIPVAHQPLISYGMAWLESAGIGTLFVCGNRNTRTADVQLMHRASGTMTFYYLEDPMPRGAAGCVSDAAIAGDSETLVVTDGASMPNVNLSDLLRAHERSGAAATVVVYSEPQGCEQPASHTPAGVYVFQRRALDLVPRRGFFDIKEHLIPRLARAGERIITYASGGAIPRVRDALTYLAVNDFAIRLRVSADPVPEGYRRRGEALIHAEASVADDAILAGPLLVGPGASILRQAVVIGPTSIGREASVGAGALVSRSAVWRRSMIHAGAVVDQSIVADDTVILPGRHAQRAVLTGRPGRGVLERLGRSSASSVPPSTGRQEPLIAGGLRLNP